MTLRKSSSLVGKVRVHFWDDTELNFHARGQKGETMWLAAEGTRSCTDASYQGIVDWVMDRHRLAQAGLDSWDGPAALLAVADGLEWDSMNHTEREHYINAARKRAYKEAVR